MGQSTTVLRKFVWALLTVSLAGCSSVPSVSDVSLPQAVVPCEGNFIAPQLSYKAEARYPAVAQMAQLEGSVLVDVLVSSTGAVKSVRVVESVHSLINKAAIDACWNCEFEPGLDNCEPVEAHAFVIYDFDL